LEEFVSGVGSRKPATLDEPSGTLFDDASVVILAAVTTRRY
jgi:hypothetical protein